MKPNGETRRDPSHTLQSSTFMWWSVNLFSRQVSATPETKELYLDPKLPYTFILYVFQMPRRLEETVVLCRLSHDALQRLPRKKGKVPIAADRAVLGVLHGIWCRVLALRRGFIVPLNVPS